MQPTVALRASGTRSAAPPASSRAPTSRDSRWQPDYQGLACRETSDMLRGTDAVRRPRRDPGRAMRDLPRRQRTSQADTPNLAGQYPVAIYKELRDFQSGARANAVMQPFVARSPTRTCSTCRLLLLSAAPAGLSSRAARAGPRIVVSGAPMRNIAPAARATVNWIPRPAAPWLEGQSAVYIKAQLQAFVRRRGGTTSASRCVTSPGR